MDHMMTLHYATFHFCQGGDQEEDARNRAMEEAYTY
uniref:Uncharacterized protein n=1 Tax=Arundo donax TaxID=35708 RepID=A0A0A8Y207_ARUDO